MVSMKAHEALLSPGSSPARGLAYWTDGKVERILYATPGYRLIELDAKTGALVPLFGKGGAVDLKLEDDQTILPDLTTGEIGLQSAPVVAKDTVIIGAAFREGMTPKTMRNNKGFVRGFDVKTGKRLWIFHTIPIKGEDGYNTWENGSAEYTGNTGVPPIRDQRAKCVAHSGSPPLGCQSCAWCRRSAHRSARRRGVSVGDKG